MISRSLIIVLDVNTDTQVSGKRTLGKLGGYSPVVGTPGLPTFTIIFRQYFHSRVLDLPGPFTKNKECN